MAPRSDSEDSEEEEEEVGLLCTTRLKPLSHAESSVTDNLLLPHLAGGRGGATALSSSGGGEEEDSRPRQRRRVRSRCSTHHRVSYYTTPELIRCDK